VRSLYYNEKSFSRRRIILEYVTVDISRALGSGGGTGDYNCHCSDQVEVSGGLSEDMRLDVNASCFTNLRRLIYKKNRPQDPVECFAFLGNQELQSHMDRRPV